MNAIEIYTGNDGQTQIEVQFEASTVWLSQLQMAELFSQTKQNISLHIRNCFKEKELDEKSVVKESLTTAADGKQYKTRFYNLDVIISIGYRVKSKRGTQFRQWATQRLQDYLLSGYAINQQRLEQLQQVVQIIQQSGNKDELNISEAKGLLEIISNYTHGFILLNQFDSQRLSNEQLNEHITYEISFDEAVEAIEELKKRLIKEKQASALFGNRKDEGFNSLLGSIIQTFGGEYLYKSIEEQAAHLLYFTSKNHPFSDGNKRIGVLKRTVK